MKPCRFVENTEDARFCVEHMLMEVDCLRVALVQVLKAADMDPRERLDLEWIYPMTVDEWKYT
jgi:hypothetical protein